VSETYQTANESPNYYDNDDDQSLELYGTRLGSKQRGKYDKSYSIRI